MSSQSHQISSSSSKPQSRRPDPSPAAPWQPRYRIPASNYLLITTPGCVYAWDAHSIRRIFKSSRQAILSAKLSKDGKQSLAVADGHVVVLHDCRRTRQESWGLNGAEDVQPRLLEYSPDAKSLFLSTALHGAVQCFTIHQTRMSRVSLEHPSPPRVLAINSNSQLMISASESPPITYVQNVGLKTEAHKLEPEVSQTPVVVAAFHPNRPEIFMLGFKDGTLAAYDASKLARKNGARMDVNASLDMGGEASEIGSFKRLHRTTNRQSMEFDWASGAARQIAASSAVQGRSLAVSAAAFIPGYHTRAVSVGGDGQCIIVDFGKKSAILQLWSLHAHATSLAVFQNRPLSRPTKEGRRDSRNRSNDVDWQSEGHCIIAVGLEHGCVALFDVLGEQIHAIELDKTLPVLDLEWIAGQTPAAIGDNDMLPRRFKHAQVQLTEESAEDDHGSVTEPLERQLPPRSERSVISRASVDAAITMPETQRYRDEIGENFGGTILRSPPAAGQPQRIQIGSQTGRFADLFSHDAQGTSRKYHQMCEVAGRRSPARPRIGSQTFIKADRGQPVVTERSSWSTLASELSVLDPNITLSHLRDVPPTNRRNRKFEGHDHRSKVVLASVSSSSSDLSPPGVNSDPRMDTLTLPSPEPIRSSEPSAVISQISSTPHAHPSPAKPKRRSRQRPSFTAYMNRTAAADLRRSSRGTNLSASFPSENRQAGDRTMDYSAYQGDNTWLTSGSATEQPASTEPTSTFQTKTSNISDHLAHVPRQESRKKPAPMLLNAQTMYYDAPTYPQTRGKDRLVDALRKDRPKSSDQGSLMPPRFLPRDPTKFQRLQELSLRTSKQAEMDTEVIPKRDKKFPAITVTPPVLGRKKGRKKTGTPSKAVVGAGRTDAPHWVGSTLAKVAALRTTRTRDNPHIPGDFPMTTTSEEVFSTPECAGTAMLDGNGDLVPPSTVIRQLCPRGSSLTPGYRTSKKLASRGATTVYTDSSHHVSNLTTQAADLDGDDTKDLGANARIWAGGRHTKRRHGITNAELRMTRQQHASLPVPREQQATIIPSPRGKATGQDPQVRFSNKALDGLVDASGTAITLDTIDETSNGTDEQVDGKGTSRQSRTNQTSSMSSGLAPSPLRVISAYGHIETDASSVSSPQKPPHARGHAQGQVISEVSGDRTCPCCETLTGEILALKGEIQALRWDVTSRRERGAFTVKGGEEG